MPCDPTLRRLRGKVLARIHKALPRMNIERALHFTRHFREQECEPLVLRWAGAMARVMDHMEIHILPHELLVGRMGPEGRYGIFYPELEGTYLLEAGLPLEEELGQFYHISPEDTRLLHNDVLPYWQGRTMRERFAAAMPEDLKSLFYQQGHVYSPSFILHETATIRHSLQWALDYDIVLRYGFMGIAARAEEKLGALDMAPHHTAEQRQERETRRVFYESVLVLCAAIRRLARRYEDHARVIASTDTAQAPHYLRLAEMCHHVPWHPARTFHEALQAQWFTQLISRIEQLHGGMISNGRMDQYLLPYYLRDREEGRIDEDEALYLLENLWGNMSQCVRIQTSPAASKIYEGNAAHWEHVTIGGLTPQGDDAVNEVSALLLHSAAKFPWAYPRVAVRVHKGSPKYFLRDVAQNMVYYNFTPVFVNDEEVIPLLTAKGASLDEARDYCTAGCAEARLLHLHSYFSGSTWLNMGAALEMALYDGFCCQSEERVGLPTGDPTRFTTFEEFWKAFQAQLEHLQIQIFRQQRIMEALRPQMVAAPLLSCLHDLCMEQGRDINAPDLTGGLNMGGQISPIGFATVLDSLFVLRDLVYEKRSINMHQLLLALRENFQGHELLRRQCQNAPKFGNGNPSVDALGRRMEACMVEMCQRHRNIYGGYGELLYVPVTGHVAMGRVTGALPNGRFAGALFSEGISPAQGMDTRGPTVALQSVVTAKASEFTARATRMSCVYLHRGNFYDRDGTDRLAAFIQAWCAQKHWHMTVRFYDEATLLAARNCMETHKNWLIRKKGHSVANTEVETEHMLETLMINKAYRS